MAQVGANEGPSGVALGFKYVTRALFSPVNVINNTIVGAKQMGSDQQGLGSTLLLGGAGAIAGLVMGIGQTVHQIAGGANLEQARVGDGPQEYETQLFTGFADDRAGYGFPVFGDDTSWIKKTSSK